MAEDENRPQRMPVLADGEDLVLGVPRPDHVGRIDLDEPLGHVAGHVLVAGSRWGERP